MKRRSYVKNLNNKIRDRDIHTRDFYTDLAKPLTYFQSSTLVEIYISRVLFFQTSYNRVAFPLASPSFYRQVVFS